jgi:hypothetical protein
MICPDCHKVVLKESVRTVDGLIQLIAWLLVLVGGNIVCSGLGCLALGLALMTAHEMPSSYCVCHLSKSHRHE